MPARHALEVPLAALTDLPQLLEAAEGYLSATDDGRVKYQCQPLWMAARSVASMIAWRSSPHGSGKTIGT